jgi:D-alanyl-D-alanine carboxypeptidase (penicillin-binding protein 5/6)
MGQGKLRRPEVFVLLVRSFVLRFVLSALFIWGAGVSAWAQTLSTTLPSVVLLDAGTGSILFEKNGAQAQTPASTIKVLTADVVFAALAAGELTLDHEFVISEHAWRSGGAPSGGSTMFANLNSHLRVDDLLRGLIIHSANDAAIALAEGLDGSEDTFALRMNKQAASLGLNAIHATNPWGRDDPQQKVSAHDMALLAYHLISTYPDYYHYFSEKEFTWNKIRQLNRNPLLLMDVGADGLFTGAINNETGFGLVGSAVQNDQRLILVVYGAKSAKERADEARKIFLWGFHSFDSRTLFADGETIGELSLYGGARSTVAVRAAGAVKILLQKGSQERVQGHILYRGPLRAPIREGDQLAHLQLTRGESIILDVPLYAQTSVDQGSLPSRALDAALEWGTGLFYAHVLKR